MIDHSANLSADFLKIRRAEIMEQANMMDRTTWRTSKEPPAHPGLAEQLADIIERNQRGMAPCADGWPSSTLGDGGPQGSDVSDRTGEAAIAYDDPARPDPYGDLTAEALAYWLDMFRARKALSGVLERIRKYDGGRQNQVSVCAEPTCTDPSWKAGRCSRCYWDRYHRQRAAGGEPVGPVDPEKIAARAGKPRREHVA